MQEILTYIYDKFEEVDIERPWFWHPTYLRFELGDDISLRDPYRVIQATYRAKTIFEQVFQPEEQTWMIFQSWVRTIPKRPKPINNGNIPQWINDFDSCSHVLVSSDETQFYSNLKKGSYKEIGEYSEYELIGIQQQTKNINYEEILAGIARYDIGFKPGICEPTYFINPSNKLVFHMYDDRGCVVIGGNHQLLQNLYNQHNDWLEETDRSKFDDMFGC